MLRRILMGSGLLTLLLTFLAIGSPTFAANPSVNANDEFATMEKTCAVIHVQLNGTQNTLTCLKSRGGSTVSNSIHSSSVSPKLTNVSCNIQGVNVEVFSNQDNPSNTVICFSGKGYTGVHITDVAEVIDTGGYSLWMRYYGYQGGGGAFCTITPSIVAAFDQNGNEHTNVLITQLDFGNGSNGGTCPHIS